MNIDFKKLLLVILMASLTISIQAQNKKPNVKPFSFFVVGDIPYNNPVDEVKFQNLINAINTANPAFSIHAGDFKSGSTPCADEYYVKILGYFGLFNKPLIYTPGDNEWTDCHREKAGGYDPIERLAFLRKTFFKESKSFGKESIPLISQRTNPLYATYMENYRWDYNEITFATIHVVGSNNNFLPDYKGFNKEFYDRDAANIAWLEETFKHAKEAASLGTVLIVHADMFYNTDGGTGFINFLANLSKLVGQYNKPVLLINGDSHKYVVDKPLMKDAKSKFALLNFTRLMVFGETEQQAVKVTIDPSNPNLFEINQFILEENK